MAYENFLLTLSEISIAVAGFSGVVGVFGVDRSSDSSAINWHRVRNLGELGVLIAGLCLFPLFLVEAGLPFPWRIASGVFVASWLVINLTAARRLVRLAVSGRYQRDAVYYIGWSFVWISYPPLIASMLGVLGNSATVYVACLASPLFVLVMSFIRLVASLSGPTDSET